MELGKMYLHDILEHNNLYVVFKEHLKVKNKGKDIRFLRDRNCFHKIARIIYKVFRGLYVSMIFYFIPYLVLFTSVL